MIYCDTSFLFSLYAWDDNPPTANAAYQRDGRRPLLFTDWQRIELRNTLRLSGHRFKRQGSPVPFKLGNSFKRIEEDLASGILRRADVDWPACFKLAEVFSAGHTEDSGVVMLDLWHVAIAASLNADTFWTFDADQHALASASRRFRKVPVLKTPPASPSPRLRD